MFEEMKDKQISELENKIKKGDLDFRFEDQHDVYYVKNIRLKGQQYSYPMYTSEIAEYQYDFLKSYLYALHTGAKSSSVFTIKHFATMGSLSNPVLMPPIITESDESGMARIDNDYVYAFIEYAGAAYQLTVFSKLLSQYHSDGIKCFISVVGTDQQAFRPRQVFEEILQEAIRHSYYRGKILNVMFENDEPIIEIRDPEEFMSERLEDVFVPDTIKNELYRFCRCVEEYDRLKMGLRYLFCGEPGTGKTKSIRAMIHACYGKATILLLQGEVNFKKIFHLGELLAPAILCLDDIDLNIGSRGNPFTSNSLGAFLQQMDGFHKNQVFMLATTNDKDLIDRAASRPGRFDMVLDFNRLEKKNYLHLIHAQCSETEILHVFDDEILQLLRAKRVTGAFLANLIKQLRVMLKVNPDADLSEYAKQFIHYTYKGFYINEEEKAFSIGFNGHDDH